MYSVLDLLAHGLSAADLSRANALGQSSSKSGQIFRTHSLDTAIGYLTKGFGDGALVAVDANCVNAMVLLGEYRLEKKAFVQIAMHNCVPLGAIVAIFLPTIIESDVAKLRCGEVGFHCPEFSALTDDERSVLRSNLNAGSVSLSERLHFYADQEFSSLSTIVTSVMKECGKSIDGGSGLKAGLQVALYGELVWRDNSVQRDLITHSIARMIQPILNLAPSTDWLRCCCMELTDEKFSFAYRFLEPLLPCAVRFLDLAPQRLTFTREQFQRNAPMIYNCFDREKISEPAGQASVL